VATEMAFMYRVSFGAAGCGRAFLAIFALLDGTVTKGARRKDPSQSSGTVLTKAAELETGLIGR
jgi:hypothetical protein